MMYSCAYWNKGGPDKQTLTEAQNAKINFLKKKLLINERDKLLEVGFGNGAFLLNIAEEHNIPLHGVSLSEEQAKIAKEKQKEKNLDNANIIFEVKDFKDIIASEVAIACFILSFVKITNTGIIIKPPPAPTSPVINPIKDPSANIISLLGARVFIFLILTIVFGDFLTIKNPATTIKIEKRSIINFSFVRIIRSVVKIISGISSIRYFLVIYTEIIAEIEKNNVVL